MKNFKLLLATTAILSTGALMANAELELNSNQTELEIRASFLRPITATMESYLGFGVIIADEGGKTVTVTPAGTLGAGSDAAIMSKASFTNYPAGETFTQSFNAGRIKYSGFGLLQDSDDEPTIEFLQSFFSLAFTYDANENHITLVGDDTNNTPCGTVDNLQVVFDVEGNDLVAKIGGTLTTANLSNITGELNCLGTTTATLIYNDSTFATMNEEDAQYLINNNNGG